MLAHLQGVGYRKYTCMNVCDRVNEACIKKDFECSVWNTIQTFGSEMFVGQKLMLNIPSEIRSHM